MSDDLRAGISWWLAALRLAPPRELPIHPRRSAPTLLHTDGSEDPSRGAARHVIGGVVFSPSLPSPLYFSAVVPKDVVDMWLPKQTHIGQLWLNPLFHLGLESASYYSITHFLILYPVWIDEVSRLLA